MKIKSIQNLITKHPECDITTKNQNFFIKTGDQYILTHNSPACYFMIDPRTGTLGVATKGIAAKSQRIYHSPKEMKDVAPGLKEKLEAALIFLRRLPLGGRAFQGDILFTKEDIHKQRIKGKDYLTFKPNVLMYAVAIDNQSELYQKIASGEFGLVVHGVYDVKIVGDSLQLDYVKNPQAILDLVEAGNDIKGLFLTHPYHQQVNINISEEDFGKVEKLLAQIDKARYETPSAKILRYFSQYINYQIKTKGVAKNVVGMKKDFLSFLDVKMAEEMNKESITRKKQSLEKGFTKMKDEVASASLDGFFGVYKDALEIKNIFINIFREIRSKIGATFFQKDNEFELTGPEGFIIASGDGIVKLVDRGVFSRTNFLFGAFSKK